MAQDQPIEAMTKIVDILTPLSSEDRSRVIRAALTLLGETNTSTEAGGDTKDSDASSLPQRARTWLKQNSLTKEELDQIFHFDNGVVEIIATHIAGKNKKEQTHNAYILTGIGQLLLIGTSTFDDKSARNLCESAGCYDSANHASYIKDRGNVFTGSKDKGWMLTAPGLKRGAEIIKDMNKLNS